MIVFLSEIKDDNYIFLKTNGLIDNFSIYKIKQFVDKNRIKFL